MASAPDFLCYLADRITAFASLHAHPPAPALRRRPSHIVLSSLRGDICALEADTEWFNIDEKQRVIRFFVSSTFDDTKHERDVLIKCVMPAFQCYARSVGFEAVLSEMRFGIRQSLSDDHKTTEVCMTELQRCIETSAGLSYMLLSCNRYGFRPPPRRIPVCDMDGMMACMPAADRSIALEFYTLDENVKRTPQECYNISVNMHGAANIPGPAYVLNSVGKVPNFWSRFPLLQTLFRSAAHRYWPCASSVHLSDPHSQHPFKFFCFSITEEEISRAIFWRGRDQLPHSVHVFQRSLLASGGRDLQQMPPLTPELKNFIDMSSDKTSVDADAPQLLRDQQHMIAQTLSHAPACLTKFQPLEWQADKGVDPSNPEHAAYLQQFAEEAITRLLKSTDDACDRLAVETHADMAEAIFHLKFAQQRGSKFVHSNETRLVTEPLNHYLEPGGSCGHAVVVWGASGSGKTYLLAESADRVARSIRSDPDAAVIVRFLGTTPASSSVHPLLFSICKQLHAISKCYPECVRATETENTSDVYDGSASTSVFDDDDCYDDDDDSWRTFDDDDANDSSEVDGDRDCTNEESDGKRIDYVEDNPYHFETDFDRLQTYFQHALRTWPYGRLVIFLDSVDQLDDSSGGRRLNWLPTHGLAPGVRLVISTLPDDPSPADGKSFKCLSALQSRRLHLSSVLEVQPVEDVPLLFSHLLQFYKQTFTANQLAIVDSAVKSSPRTQTPLVVTILVNRLSEWPSHADLNLCSIDTSSVRALIIQEFKRFEVKHGVELVRSALSFITLARDGVSEAELLEILSLDDDVLASVYEWWVPATRTLPTNPLTMLLVDLKPYLTMRGASNGSSGLMIRWYHRQFWEAADEFFLCDADERQRRYAQLGEFFAGTWAGCKKPYGHKLKMVIQKKIAGEDSGDRRVRPQPLCLRDGKIIFQTKGDAGAVNERRCREAAYHFLGAGMLCEAAGELCSFEGICARARCGEGFVLQHQLLELGLRIREQIRGRDGRALNVLRKVEHYARWLQKDMSSIVADPEIATISSCSCQPEISLARQDLRDYLQRTSGGVSFDSNAVYRSFSLGASRQDFDCCLFELKHHTKEVTCVAYNVDGSFLASASWDKTVAIWNTKNGTVEGILKGHTDGVQCVAWSPDGSQLVTCSYDKTIRLWDAATYQVIATLVGHSAWVSAVAFDASGRYIASCSSDETIRLWDATTLKTIITWHAESTCMNAVAFDSSGRYLASCFTGNTIRLWDTTTHQAIATLQGHTGPVEAIAFDASGRYIASGSRHNDYTIRLWDLTTQQAIATLESDDAGGVDSVVFDRNGRYIISGHDDGTIILWDMTTHQVVANLLGHSRGIVSVACDASGRCIASGSIDKTIRLWDVTSHQAVESAKKCSHLCNPIAFDSSGKHIASCSDGETICLWDVATLKAVTSLRSESGQFTSFAFDAIGRYFAACSYDKTIRLWDAATYQVIATLEGHSAWVNEVVFDASGRYIASCSSDQTIRLWDATTLKTIITWHGHSRDVSAVAFDPSARYVVSGSLDKTIRLWDVNTLHVVATLHGHLGNVVAISFDGSGKYIVSGSTDSTIRLWDVAALKAIVTLQGHSKPVNAVVFDVSGRYIASGSEDHTIRLWDLEKRETITCLTGHSSSITSLMFSPTSSHLVTASLDNTVRLWSTYSGAATSMPALPSSAAVSCTAWSIDGALYARGACDGSVTVWEAGTGLQRIALQCPQTAAMSAISISPCARLLAVAMDATPACAHVFDMTSALLMASPALNAVAGLHWSANGCTLQNLQGDVWHSP